MSKMPTFVFDAETDHEFAAFGSIECVDNIPVSIDTEPRVVCEADVVIRNGLIQITFLARPAGIPEDRLREIAKSELVRHLKNGHFR